jgi:hypothetical protein
MIFAFNQNSLAGEDSISLGGTEVKIGMKKSDVLPTLEKVYSIFPLPFDEKGKDYGITEKNKKFPYEYIGSISFADDKVKKEVSMAIGLDPKQAVPLEELLMSLVVQQEALIRLLVEKGIFSKEELWEMVKVVNKEMKPITIRLPTPVEGR